MGIVRVEAAAGPDGEVRRITVDTGIEVVRLSGFERMDDIFTSLAAAAEGRASSRAAASPPWRARLGRNAAVLLVLVGGLAALLFAAKLLGMPAPLAGALAGGAVPMLIGVAFVTLQPISQGGWSAARRIDTVLGAGLVVIGVLRAVLGVIQLSV